MRDISDMLHQEGVLPSLAASCRKQALQKIAATSAEFINVSEQIICDALQQREMLGTTAVGNGVAIPHARLPQIEHPYCFFARLEGPIDYESPDNKPVDLLFTIFVPEEDQTDHLKLLARVARIMRDKDQCDALRDAYTSESLYKLLITYDAN